MKKQYQNPNTFTMSFAVNDIVMGSTLNNSVAGTDPIDVPFENAPKRMV